MRDNAKQILFLMVLLAGFTVFMVQVPARLYWPYLVSNYIIAIGVYYWEYRKERMLEKPGLGRYLFPKDIWQHPSTFNDSILALVNFGLILSVFNYGIFSTKFYKDAAHSLSAYWPAAATTEPASASIMVLFTLAALAAGEFFYYWYHRMMHTVPAFWEFHKVHHSAKVMTPIAVYRLHPVDFWLTAAIRSFGVALLDVVFLHYYSGPANFWVLAKVNGFIFLANLLGGVLHHSHIWLSFGPWAERFIISPAQHQIHHSENAAHYNKNYGAVLSIWDWVFGSVYLTKADNENITLGLGDPKEEESYSTAIGLLTSPFVKIVNMAKRRKMRAQQTPDG